MFRESAEQMLIIVELASPEVLVALRLPEFQRQVKSIYMHLNDDELIVAKQRKRKNSKKNMFFLSSAY